MTETISIGSAGGGGSEAVVTEAQYKQALKRLNRLEKQNVFLLEELVKSRQCLHQMKLEREIIIDKVADSLISQSDPFDEDEDEFEDISDISSDEGTEDHKINQKKRFKRELVEELCEEAEGNESFARVLSELSGYQAATVSAEPKRKSVSLTFSASNPSNSSNTTTTAPSSMNSNSKKRNKPPTSGSRFNRLSALTQAMRTGIISDDEGSSTNNNGSEDVINIIDNFDGEEDTELALIKRVRRGSLTGSTTQGSAGLQSQYQFESAANKEESTVYKVIPVPFDSEGRPALPLSLNMITVHRLGEIVFDRPAYHSKRYILPVGYTASRSYLSVLSPDTTINYFSTILDNGPLPLYQVTPEGHPEMTFQSASTTGAWAAVAKAAASLRGKDSAPSVSGPDFFGLANPTVSMLIERLPNSDKCITYTPKKYEVSNLVGGKSVKRSETANTTNISINNPTTSTTTGAVSNHNTINSIVNIESDPSNTSTFDIHNSYQI